MRADQMSYWRNKARPIIAKVLEDNAGKSEPEVRKALRDAFPFGPKQYHPYKIWLDEIARQMGKKWPIGHKVAWQNNKKRISRDQQKLREWEQLYGTHITVEEV